MEKESPVRDFDQILRKACSCEARRLAIAGAGNVEIISAIKEAVSKKFVYPILVGEESKIKPLVEEVGLEGDYEIHDVSGEKEISQKTVEFAKTGRAQMLMKGKVPTGTFLKAVLARENEIRTGELLSHTAVVEVQSYPKLMLVTDGGINIAPSLDEKVSILKNSIKIANGLGISKPKVAVLSAIEVVNPRVPETVEAEALMKLGEQGEFGDIDIDGPLAMDLAISSYAAQLKGYNSSVVGEADIFLVSHFTVCNVVVKALIYLAEARVGGIIMGARVPIILLSRSDTAEIKLCSIALSCVVV